MVTEDIDNFWQAFDLIKKESDSLLQVQLIDSLYIQKGSIGLEKIMDVREYSAGEYVSFINNYPNFFESIRSNTLRSKLLFLTPFKTSLAKMAGHPINYTYTLDHKPYTLILIPLFRYNVYQSPKP